MSENTGRMGKAICRAGCETRHEVFEKLYVNGSIHWLYFCPEEGWRHITEEEVEIYSDKKAPTQLSFNL